MKLKLKIKWWHVVILLVIAINVFLWQTKKFYLYKALVYNFVNIDDINLFPTRTVKAGTGMPWNIAADYNKKELSPELRNTLEGYESVAFLVIQNDSIKYEEYWDNYGKDSLSNSFSMAKSIVSILIGIAIDEKKIKSIDQTIYDYIPQYANDDNRVLTIRDLLTMSSGLNYDEGYTSLFGPTTRSYYDTDLRKQMYELRVVAPPGREFNYMSCNTQLLAFIIEKATGLTLSEYASEKLWKPIGAENDAQWSLDHEGGDEKAYCCFYSNARDFARIGKLFLQNGMWNGKQIVSADYVKKCITPAPLKEHGIAFNNYGFQWWLMEYERHKIFYARGILGQYIIVIPDINLIFVRLGHKRGEKDADGQLLDVPVYLKEVLKMYGENYTSTKQIDSLVVQ
jgi:CubicO group peptidase (beta-lactamase class C family)